MSAKLHAQPGIPDDALPFALRAGWGVGGLGSYTILSTSSLLLLFFMTTALGIEPAVAGAIMFVSKIYDMALNPVVGTLSDRTRSRWGRRRPYILVGAALASTALVLMFNAPVFARESATIAWMVATLLLLATGYTFFNVPYLSMPAEMTGSFHERTVLMSYRVFFVSVATLVSTSAAPALVEAMGGGRTGFAAMAWLVGGTCLVAMLACFAGTAQARFTEPTTLRPGFVEQARTVLSNQPFRVFIGAKFLQLVGLSASSVALPFLMTTALGRGGYGLATFGLASTVGTMASMPAWVSASKRLGKRNVYVASIVVFAITKCSWVLATPQESDFAFLVRALLTGITAGGIMLLGTSLLPDCAEYDYRRTGMRREGLYSGFYSFVEKTAFAIGPLLSGLILSAGGFVKSTGGAAPLQPQSAIDAVYFTSSVIPALAPLLSIAFLWRYRLTQEQIAATVPLAAAGSAGTAPGAGAAASTSVSAAVVHPPAAPAGPAGAPTR
ncbi:MAG: MFS transporter [Steroidobacteraceae bacterium]|jgi:GPH family glycoside/pentoside/hexuronide:cation symporter|nr:MFS transporter [Steroidobacteraceae bacterium]